MARPKKEVKPKSNLLEKIMSNANSDMACLIENSSYFTDEIDFVVTEIPALNIALCGKRTGGFSGGLVEIGAPSKHFKSSFGLVCMKAFQMKNPEGIIIFYDSEGGITLDMMKEHGIDLKRVVHDWVTDTDELVTKFIPQLEGLEDKDPVMMFVDSIGNISSKREFDNAMKGEVKADMGVRAKEIKSFTRMANAKLKIKRIPCFMINHSYKTLETYSKDQHGGGTGVAYASDTMFSISRSQDKDKDTNVNEGWYFKLKVDKSRFIKESSTFDIHVTYEKGILKYSGLATIAESFGILEKTRGGKSGKEIAYRFDDMIVTEEESETDEVFWNRVFTESDFDKLVEAHYKLGKKETTVTASDSEVE